MRQIIREKINSIYMEAHKNMQLKEMTKAGSFCTFQRTTMTNASQAALLIKNPPANAGNVKDGHLIPELGRKWQPTPEFLSGESSSSEDPGWL